MFCLRVVMLCFFRIIAQLLSERLILFVALDVRRIKDGNAETLYPRSSFAINCTGDVCKGDVVLFTQKVYKKFGKRTIAGRVVKESYGAAKQQHTFTTYLGIQIFRFYFKCTNYSAELTTKTDPQNSDYVVELGASRNFEPWRAKDEEADKEKQKRETEEMGDAMKSLENRTLDSKREMDILVALG
ncbi:splicing factor YJU2-like isoform X1 [Camellia sinensis]|uniref:splicing factor YJU2-like isoform X1 n=1 Tax=Camellia sinensis TaxID=4442 RepID=UPI001035AD0F|nr:splicing factor YJU2-like isoform X1 [Camellia sinensis]